MAEPQWELKSNGSVCKGGTYELNRRYCACRD
jgi:hypothetical protein